MCKISRPGLYKDGQDGVVFPADIARSRYTIIAWKELGRSNSSHNTAAEFGTVLSKLSCDLPTGTVTSISGRTFKPSSSRQLLVEDWVSISTTRNYIGVTNFEVDGPELLF